MALSDKDREYYNTFSEEVRKEYKKQHMEFRATGYYNPSKTFERTDGAGLWVRKNVHEKNALELEIASYDSVVFPMRPPEFDGEYRRRELESKKRRKEKLLAEAKGKPVLRRYRKAPPESSQEQQKQQDEEKSGTNSSDQGEDDGRGEAAAEQEKRSGSE